MRFNHLAAFVVFLLCTSAGRAIEAKHLEAIDKAVQEAIGRGDCPGAVVVINHHGRAIHQKAYGLRGQEPGAVPMTLDTVFDLASLTKPVATATSIFILVEQGKL